MESAFETMIFSLFSKTFPFFGKATIPKELVDPKRILITHFGSTAEIIRSTPLAVALRHRFPYTDIAWLIDEETAPLLFDHWAVNRFIVVRQDWYKKRTDIVWVRDRLQTFDPHVAIDPQNSFASSMAAWLSGALYRIGLGKEKSRLFHNIHIAAEETHKIERHLQLLQPFGIFGSSIGFDLPECEKDCIAARHILQEKGIPNDFALLHITANTPLERWHEDRYAVLAKYLLNTWNLPSLITWSGNEDESKKAEAVVHASDGAAVACTWTSLSIRRSLAKSATIFVGSDTAEMQIAAAVGVKCVGLFGPTSVLENAPWGKEHRTVQVHKPKKRKRKGLPEWMDTMTVESVCKKCDEVLTEISRDAVLPIEFPISTRKRAA